MDIIRTFFIGANLLIHARTRDIPQAEALLEQFDHQVMKFYLVARHYFTLGKCYLYLAKEDYPTTLETAAAFLSSLQGAGVRYINAEILMIMGITYMKQGAWDEAKTKFEEGIQLAEQIGSRKDLWQLYYHQGKLYTQLGEASQAAECFRQANACVDYIIKNLHDEALKNTFLAREEVVFLFSKQEVIEK